MKYPVKEEMVMMEEDKEVVGGCEVIVVVTVVKEEVRVAVMDVVRGGVEVKAVMEEGMG